MADRPDVATSSAPIAVANLVGLAGQLAVGLGRLPFRKPWEGPDSVAHNLVAALTREEVRTFLSYSTSLPTEEFRSIELVLDRLCRAVMPPIVRRHGVTTRDDTLAGVPCIWYEPIGVDDPDTILYLHGGGYIGTSPSMYAYFTAALAQATDCRVLVPDFRLAPEFPYPAGRIDIIGVYEDLLLGGVAADRVVLAGDSGGGGLVGSVLYALADTGVVGPNAVLLFSPEVDLEFARPSVRANAGVDVLPWNIPSAPYLHGLDASDPAVSEMNQDVAGWPPVFMAWGAQEILRDQITDFAAHLRASGVNVTAIEAQGMFHVYPILMPWADSSRRLFDELGTFIRDLARKRPGDEATPA